MIENTINDLVAQADNDKGAAEALLAAGYYAHALFWLHLVLEKLCKAVWVKKNNDIKYPYIHNLLRLLRESGIEITSMQAEFFASMNQFQAMGRYGDDLRKLEETVQKQSCENYFDKGNAEIKWLKELMQ